jgi:dephospho-CoA kinase
MCGELKFIICLTGLPGSGKTTVAQKIAQMGFYYISLGDVVREQTKIRGLAINSVNLGSVMVALRKENGPQAVAELSLKVFPKDGELVVVDGIRSNYEVDAYRSICKVRLLAIHASPQRRFEFLEFRDRSDAPTSRTDFDLRDKRELEIGVGNAIALADEIISNNSSMRDLIQKAKRIVKFWLEEDDSR